MSTLDYANFRFIAADAIDAYIRGEIDNFALDDALFDSRHDDDLLHKIAVEIWYHYDDLSRHRNDGNRKLNELAVTVFQRWAFLLRSPVTWEEIIGAPQKPLGRWAQFFHRRQLPRLEVNNVFWPFENEGAWNAFRASVKSADMRK